MLPFHTLDVFTTTPYTGNPLAVVLGADALTTAQMQVMAAEFNLSETIFVRPPHDPAHTAEVRIFFPTAEIPFAGHPTIGCAVLLAEMAHGPGDWDALITLEEQAGLVPVALSRRAGITTAELTAPVIPHTHPGTAPALLLAAALGLAQADIGFGPHQPGIWAGGPAFVYVPLSSLDALSRARPTDPAWTALVAQSAHVGVYLYTTGQGADFQARMFSPGAGIPEDPATGSASAILAAQLFNAGLIGPGTTRFTLRQGVEMGRPSDIGLTVEADATGLTAVRIKGSAVRISQGLISPPAP